MSDHGVAPNVGPGPRPDGPASRMVVECIPDDRDLGAQYTRWMNAVRIGARHVGPGHPIFIVAEIGINHNGDVDLAKRTCRGGGPGGV